MYVSVKNIINIIFYKKTNSKLYKNLYIENQANNQHSHMKCKVIELKHN